jgi:hypothetical protein
MAKKHTRQQSKKPSPNVARAIRRGLDKWIATLAHKNKRTYNAQLELILEQWQKSYPGEPKP